MVVGYIGEVYNVGKLPIYHIKARLSDSLEPYMVGGEFKLTIMNKKPFNHIKARSSDIFEVYMMNGVNVK